MCFYLFYMLYVYLRVIGALVFLSLGRAAAPSIKNSNEFCTEACTRFICFCL